MLVAGSGLESTVAAHERVLLFTRKRALDSRDSGTVEAGTLGKHLQNTSDSGRLGEQLSAVACKSSALGVSLLISHDCGVWRTAAALSNAEQRLMN